MKSLAAALISGTLFGIGLTLSDMVNPARVLAFLDVAGAWDPSLALVLAGATGVTVLSFRSILRRRHPLFGGQFRLPTRTDIDGELLLGAGLFGIGWGLVGLCPGPAFTALLLGRWEIGVFLTSMIAGMLVHTALQRVPRPMTNS